MLDCTETWVAVVGRIHHKGMEFIKTSYPQDLGLGMLPELHLNFHPAGWRGKLFSGSEKLVAMSGSPGLGKGRGDEICRESGQPNLQCYTTPIHTHMDV